MRAICFGVLALGLVGLAGFDPSRAADDQDAAAKVDALIAQMTPEEKAAQLKAVLFKDLIANGRLSLEKCQQRIPHGIGEICGVGYTTTLEATAIKEALAELQDFLRTKTRLGVPGIAHEENITGLPVTGATTYPQMIGMACTWDPDLMRQNADATRRAMLWIGGRQALSPVLDVHNDAHWGRIEEAFGAPATGPARRRGHADDRARELPGAGRRLVDRHPAAGQPGSRRREGDAAAPGAVL